MNTGSLETLSSNLTRQDLFLVLLQVWDVLFKKLIEVVVQQSIYSLITDVILLEGFKGFNLKTETGGIVNDDTELFAYYLCKKIGIAQGYLPEL